MRIPRKGRLLVEPPSAATGDIAFNLLVFFLVCASTTPDKGRRQDIPRAEKEQKQESKLKNLEVVISRTRVQVGEEGNPLDRTTFEDASVVHLAAGGGAEETETPLSGETRGKLRAELSRRGLDPRKPPDQRIIVVRSEKDAPYYRWIQAATVIEKAGGVITLQLEESREVIIK